MEKIGKRFAGKVAIVTASTQGIGFAIAERLGLEGAAVVVSSRRRENVDAAVKKLRDKGIESMGLVCHVSNAQHRKYLIMNTIRKYGKLDTIVCNAAANPSMDGILEMKESLLDKLWEINVKSSILLLQEIAPHLQKGSSVAFVSSITGFQPPKGLAMYGVTKTALLGLTKALAAEMAPDTRVNCVAPGYVPTNFASYLTSNEHMVIFNPKSVENACNSVSLYPGLWDRPPTPDRGTVAYSFGFADLPTFDISVFHPGLNPVPGNYVLSNLIDVVMLCL